MKVDWDELKRLHEATTKGPWMLVPFNAPATHGVEPYCLRISDKGPRFVSVDRGESLCAADGEWIAALHNAFHAILAEREVAQRLRDAGEKLDSAMGRNEDELAELHKDALRWRDCVANGFPAQEKVVCTAHAPYWCCMRGGFLYQGETAAAAVDEAMQAAAKAPAPSPKASP